MAIHILRALAFLAIVAASASSARMTTESHKDDEVDLVAGVPGQPSATFRQFAGYVRINEDKSLFYWFFHAIEAPSEKPLLLWLNGGPGCSSVAIGALKELGPFLLDKDGATLRLNPYPWNKAANLLFLDSPVGVGFSYTNKTSDLEHPSDQTTAEDSYAFLLGWFDKFPQFKSHDFYIAGESYAGHYVPQLAELIHGRNETVSINLKGIMMGNPYLEDIINDMAAVEFAWNRGIIPQNLHRAIMAECKPLLDRFDEEKDANCSQLFQDFGGYLVGIDIYNIHKSSCSHATISEAGIGGGLDQCGASSETLMNKEAEFLGRADVQKALHANVTGVIRYPYSSCSSTLRSAYNISEVRTVVPAIRRLLDAGCRVWVYSGDEDLAVPFEGTRESIMRMNLTEKKTGAAVAAGRWGGWRAWFWEGQVAGWMTEYAEGLSFISVRGVGHMVPFHAPATSLGILSHFLKGEPLPSNATAA